MLRRVALNHTHECKCFRLNYVYYFINITNSISLAKVPRLYVLSHLVAIHQFLSTYFTCKIGTDLFGCHYLHKHFVTKKRTHSHRFDFLSKILFEFASSSLNLLGIKLSIYFFLITDDIFLKRIVRVSKLEFTLFRGAFVIFYFFTYTYLFISRYFPLYDR